MNAMFALRSESTRVPYTTFYLNDGTFVIGRSTKCDLVLRDDSVSRRHAELVVARGAVRVRDLQSRNGTFIDAQRVTTASVARGQQVTFGNVTFALNAGIDLDEPVSDEDTATASGPTRQADLDEAALSKAQRRVLPGLLEGLAEKQIARQLHLSQTTVHNHVQAIYRSFDVHSRSELLARFLKRNSGTK